MKIYFYTKYFPPDPTIIGSEGTRKAIHGLASGLAACGINVTVLSEREEGGVFDMPEGYQIRCFANPQPLRQSFKVNPALKQFVRQQLDRSSLVILNGIFQPSIYALSAFLHKSSVPYAIAPHDPYNPAMFSSNPQLKWLYWFLCERPMLQRAIAVQVLDPRHGEFIRHLKVKTPVVAVPNGFVPSDVCAETDLVWNTEHSPKLFFLGRMDAHNKGLDLLLNAFAQVTQTIDAKLTLQGLDKGDLKKLEAQAAALSLSDRTAFLPPDYQTSPPMLMQNYDLFCLPSRFEGFGLSALEAMLAGRVLLVSEVAGIAPHIQASGCGVVVAPEESAIQAGLLDLLERRSQWPAMGLQGRNYALEHLRWDTIAASALEQYVPLLS